MKNFFLVLLCVSFLYGCQSGYRVQYDSAPQSAMVVCGYEQKGYTPINLYYPKEAIQNGILKTIPCEAIWSSGYRTYFNNMIDTKQFPNGVRNSVQNPYMNNQDIQFDYQKKQADAKATSEAVKNFNEAMQNIGPKTTYCNQIGFQTVCNTY
ncbi:hypothetical protein [Acinetobacter faecalis]|uniref:hypothetical protein n=1 Tax=Acinetobacter faecalis TaxID=2665161 RepID=UPI002A915641|nr:hypothetical protein [Acinetobacter faecalis]MDY6490463.1 hypothetical protein [Acinetobacter faecalis]